MTGSWGLRYVQWWDTPNQIRASETTDGWSVSHHLYLADWNQAYNPYQRYFSSVPPSGRAWHKAFLWWVQTQSRSPDAPGIPKNATGPVSIPLKQGRPRCQAINLTPPRRVKAWGTAPWGPWYVQWWVTPDQIRATETTTGWSVSHQLNSADWNQPYNPYQLPEKITVHYYILIGRVLCVLNIGIIPQQLDIRNRILNWLQCASPSTHQTMMI